MVCAQVFGNDTTINFAGASGQLELNTFKPVIIYNFLQSVQILADACNMFEKYCIKGLKANKTAIQAYLEKTFIHINDLQPYIGIENTNAILKQAAKENITLKEAALKLNILTTDEFDRYVKIEKMLAPNIVVVKGRKR
ncbi:Fumarate hydratase class II [bioreactor metagenome]|uniref:Fumarate hydratase class II n=1 Tax=bioreactor metagenome TaxID=1076179 RepID=A0A645HIU8_9ZZZZ